MSRDAALAVLLVLAVLLGAVSARPAPAAAQSDPTTQAVAVERIAGASRIDTAARIAQVAFPDGAATVVVARADAYADALAGGPLAAGLDAPILLTGSDRLAGEAATAFRALGATRAVLLGGEQALAGQVEADLRAAGATTVERITGADRFATAAAIAERVGGTAAYLAEGASADPQRGWPDALAASPLAAFEGRPILLTGASDLPDATAAALDRLGVTDVTVVGGSAAVSDGVAGEVAATGVRVDRVAGDSRYDTAALLLDRAASAGMSTATVWVASGASWPDALVAGPAAARDGVLLLTDPGSMAAAPPTAAWLHAHPEALTRRLVGGAAVLSTVVEAELRGGATPAGPGTPPPAEPDPYPVEDPAAPPAAPAAEAPPGDIQVPTPAELPRTGLRPEPLEAGPPAPSVPAGAGRWSDPATWGGRVPAAGEDVQIPAGQAVVLDVTPPALGGLTIDGELHVADDGDLGLRARWVLLRGRLAAGAASTPRTHRFELVLDGAPTDDVAGMGAQGLVVAGGILDLHGAVAGPTWTRLATTAGAGADRLELEEPVGWRPGDRVVLAASDLTPDNAEEATVEAVQGTTVVLTAPLQHDHWSVSERYAAGEVAERAEVGLLTHRIVVRGPDDARATGFGGQIPVLAGSTARLSGVELADMGQSGIKGRYPLHFHQMGPAPASFLRDSSVHHSANRCVAVHGSDRLLVAGVVAHDAVGHCFFVEDGVETGNRFVCDLGLTTRAPEAGARLLDSDATPATFWLSNPDNQITDSAAAGSDGNGFWYDLPDEATGLAEGSGARPREAPLGGFTRNVSHSNRETGWKTGNGLFVDEYEPLGDAVFADFTAWKNGGFGAWLEHDAVLRRATLADNSTGFLGRRSTLDGAVVVGQTSNAAESPWRSLGVAFYIDRSHVEDVAFVNFRQGDRGPVSAVGHHSHTSMTIPTVARLSFTNSDVLRIRPADEAGLQSGVVFADLDGSVNPSGDPAMIVAENPLLTGPGCASLPGTGAAACPAGDRFAFFKLEDRAGGATLEPAALVRDDGVMYPLLGDQEHSAVAAVEGQVRLDRDHTVSLGGPTPTRLHLVLANDARGWGDFAIPWTGSQAYVYKPWDLGSPFTAVADAGALAAHGDWWLDDAADLLHVRLALTEDTIWSQLEICATPGCA